MTRAAVDRAAARPCARQQELPPIRVATRLIEEDPDTMLDVLHLLDHGSLPRARSWQMPTRTGTDRLQLSGVVVLDRWPLYPDEPGLPAGAGGTFRHRAGCPHPAHRRALGRGHRQPSAAYGWCPEDHDPRPQLLEATVQSIYAADSVERPACELLADGLRL